MGTALTRLCPPYEIQSKDPIQFGDPVQSGRNALWQSIVAIMQQAGAVVWELRNITKAFGPIRANDNVSLALKHGEIHGLVGQNGSGKSTLIKTLCGAHQPDSGTILHDGQPVRLSGPLSARALGIATVFQEFSLVPNMSVAENIFLGAWPMGPLGVDWRRMREDARRVLAELEIDISPDDLVADLTVARQQMVEIAKAFAQDASMIILDEPTAALAAREVEHLFALLRRMREQQAAILYISHRLDEIVQLVDVVTILRNGRVVSPAGETPIDASDIAAKMVGQSIEEYYPKERNVSAEVLLEVRNVATDRGISSVSFTLHRGEVLGLGGLLGSGRTRIARALFGIDPITSGEILVKGRRISLNSPADAAAAGLAFLPEDRKRDGLFFNFDGCKNITIANLRGLLRGVQLDLAREQEVARDVIGRLEISPAAVDGTPEQLSGGNQQKIILGRWLYAGADIFILDEPTQGIDIGAKTAVFRLINELTRSGKGVVLITSHDDELLAMSDRIAMVRRGRILRVAEAGSVSKTDLMQGAGEVAAA